MEDPVRSDETLKELLQSSIRSTGFWSAVAAVVGIGALVLGGILYPAVDEVRDFSVTLLIIGAALLFSALVISPRTVAKFLIGRQGRFGANVVVMTVAFFAIVVLINFWWTETPPDSTSPPPEYSASPPRPPRFLTS